MEGYSRIKDNANILLNKFSSNRYISGTQDFLNSNSIVATFAFIILVFIVFAILLRIGGTILSWIFSPSEEPVLLPGMINAKQMVKIPQNPSVKNAIPIVRSVNDMTGIEFTWSVWIYIDDHDINKDKYKHIFHKGNAELDANGMIHPNNAPGLYIKPKEYGTGTNADRLDLEVAMNTFSEINTDNAIMDKVTIREVPMYKWINIILRVSAQNQLDIYINGSLVKRHMLSGVPKQNYGDVYVSMNGGFSGFTSKLQYFNTAIGINKIQGIIDSGPDMTMKSSGITKSVPQYLSTRWYMDGIIDGISGQ